MSLLFNKKPLVVNADLAALTGLDECRPFEIQNMQRMEASGGFSVYYLLKDTVIVYVGKAKSVSARLLQHAKDKEFDSVYYHSGLCERDAFVSEASAIKQFQPKYNSGNELSRFGYTSASNFKNALQRHSGKSVGIRDVRKAMKLCPSILVYKERSLALTQEIAHFYNVVMEGKV